MFAEDASRTLWTSGGGQVVGWLNTKMFEETHDEAKSQGWTALVMDTNAGAVNVSQASWLEGRMARPPMAQVENARITTALDLAGYRITRNLGLVRALGAHAIVCVRYDANEVTAGVTEVLAYGTAVVVEPFAG